MVEGFYQFVEIEVTYFWFFESLLQSIIFEVPDSFEEGNLGYDIFTPLLLFRPDREFSTMTRFLPGEMRDAFQNSVPKSMPMTCDWARASTKAMRTRDMIFIRLIIL